MGKIRDMSGNNEDGRKMHEHLGIWIRALCEFTMVTISSVMKRWGKEWSYGVFNEVEEMFSSSGNTCCLPERCFGQVRKEGKKKRKEDGILLVWQKKMLISLVINDNSNDDDDNDHNDGDGDDDDGDGDKGLMPTVKRSIFEVVLIVVYCCCIVQWRSIGAGHHRPKFDRSSSESKQRFSSLPPGSFPHVTSQFILLILVIFAIASTIRYSQYVMIHWNDSFVWIYPQYMSMIGNNLKRFLWINKDDTFRLALFFSPPILPSGSWHFNSSLHHIPLAAIVRLIENCCTRKLMSEIEL